MRETVTGGWVPIVREGESSPDGPLYGRVRPLLAPNRLPAALTVQQPLYGQQPRPCCALRGGRRRSRSLAKLSTSHGPILPRTERRPDHPRRHTSPITPV